MLVAGHIKPWKDSTSAERMDLRNGLAACLSHDLAFDTGLRDAILLPDQAQRPGRKYLTGTGPTSSPADQGPYSRPFS
jgi:predicted restriction endonuclease